VDGTQQKPGRRSPKQPGRVSDRAPKDNFSGGPHSHPKDGRRAKLKYPEISFAKEDANKLPYCLFDEFTFGVIRKNKGTRRLLEENALNALKESRERKFQPPRIQTLFRMALTIQSALESQPEASKSKLAKKFGITRPRIT
jgi:hypothetical protein